MKPDEVTDERFFLTGSRGHIFADHEAHIARKGLDPETLCGIPMLFTNYYKGNEHEVNTICTHCEDVYRQITGTKVIDTEKEYIEFTLMLPVKVQMFPGDFESEEKFEEAKAKCLARDGETIDELFWQNLESEEIIDEANRQGVAENDNVKIEIKRHQE